MLLACTGTALQRHSAQMSKKAGGGPAGHSGKNAVNEFDNDDAYE